MREQLAVLRPRRGEGVMHGRPAALFRIEREHRKLDDPGEVHRGRIVELQLGPQPLPQGVEGLAGGLELVGHQQQQVARRGVHAPAILASRSALKFLAIGEASLPSASTLNQASPLAPKFSTTKAVSSSMPLRE